MSGRVTALVVLGLGLGLSAPVAEAGECHLIDVSFQPEQRTDLTPGKTYAPQIVIWLEDTAGNYIDTLFITQQTGTYGLGNRPGRFDFNSGPKWPYGRRITVFPVWAHKKLPADFDEIMFQRSSDEIPADDNNLSHPFNKSSPEMHYCRPMQPLEPSFDAMTCASPNTVFTDKGVRDAARRNPYPPRQDITRVPGDRDDPSVDTYNDMNPFDAISQATPVSGTLSTISWQIPDGLEIGDYVVWMEVSTEFDHNATYSTTAYPAPDGIPWSEYGEPYRGQPSVVYKLPFTFGQTATTASTATYAGYGDPDGATGTLHPPDSTITTDKLGSGLQRLGLVVDPAGDFRARATLRIDFDFVAPANPAQLAVDADSRYAEVSFLAPGDDGNLGKVKTYEIRYRMGDELVTDANWDAPDTLAYTNVPLPGEPGTVQSFALLGLLPETAYTVGVRAVDDCFNKSSIRSVAFVTPPRSVGEVDACFVATAAYGSALAADVTMLRQVRDSLLRKTVLGELAVQSYYTFGPALAGVVGESDLLRATARAWLGPIVRYVKQLSF